MSGPAEASEEWFLGRVRAELGRAELEAHRVRQLARGRTGPAVAHCEELAALLQRSAMLFERELVRRGEARGFPLPGQGGHLQAVTRVVFGSDPE